LWIVDFEDGEAVIFARTVPGLMNRARPCTMYPVVECKEK